MEWVQIGSTSFPIFDQDMLKYFPGQMNDYGELSPGYWGFNNPWLYTTWNDKWFQEKGVPDWMFNGSNVDFQGDETGFAGLKIKSAKKEGTVAPYKLINGKYVPDASQARVQSWNTNIPIQDKLALAAGAAAFTAPLWAPAVAGAVGGGTGAAVAGGGGTGLIPGTTLGGGLTAGTSLGAGIVPGASALVPEALAPALGLGGAGAASSSGIMDKLLSYAGNKLTDPSTIKSVVQGLMNNNNPAGTGGNLSVFAGRGNSPDNLAAFQSERSKLAAKRAAMEADALRGPTFFNPNAGAQNGY